MAFALPRLRQVALVARDCHETSKLLETAFGWAAPFHDPGVSEFGLENAVYAAGDTFIEVVSPVADGTTAGRYLERRGGDSGYMAIFQVDDVVSARQRVAEAGIRIVWQLDLADMAGSHLHPKDVPGAIVSLDWADPPESWRWAGPDWIGRGPKPARTSKDLAGSIAGLTIEVSDPAVVATCWARVLDTEPDQDPVDSGTATIALAGGAQVLRFVALSAGHSEGITEVALYPNGLVPPVAEIGGVRFVRTSSDPIR